MTLVATASGVGAVAALVSPTPVIEGSRST